MALTKVTKSGITDNAIDADKIEDGTILDADITPGTITNAKLAGSISNDKLTNSSLTINGSSVSLGSSISAGALDWQAVITADGSTGTTGVAGRGYFIDTTSAAHTFTLPSSPTIGDTIAIVDYAGTFGTNALTIARNGNNIQGVANNSLIGTNRASVTLVYVDATKGWVYQNESNVANLQEPLLEATGGTIATLGDFKIHTFTGDGCFVVSSVSPSGPGSVDYLVVAGGGGGAKAARGAGGGAGGYRTTFPSPGCNAGSFPIAAQTYPITVGGGGTSGAVCNGPAPSMLGTSGSNSVFSTITSSGGGGGQAQIQPGGAGGAGAAGGSGGGAGGAGCSIGASLPGGSGNSPPVSPSQGNPGGNGGSSPGFSGGGGGGGASAAGTSVGPGPAPAQQPLYGQGGAGSANSISGSPVTYAGGGGGGQYSFPGPGALGGAGGGGKGGGYNCSPSTPVPLQATAGATNTGGGGGGFSLYCTAGGAGGKGIVIIRYKFQ